MKTGILAAVLFAVFGSASAQSACDKIDRSIEERIKEISFYTHSGLLDSSAPRETNRALKLNAEYAAVQILLIQQAAAKCRPFVEPINGSEYATDVLKCVSASSGDSVRQLCDRSGWKRM